MVPHSIKLTGLTGALHDLKESIIISGLDCELDIHGFSNQMLSEQNSNMIYRMLQELTTNTIKHARANKILIQLLVHQKELQILVEDNGKGFDIHDVTTNGIGLQSVQSRVEYLGGKLMIDSSPSHGTTIHIQMNIEKIGV
jgi:signal transduction histidine kinase